MQHYNYYVCLRTKPYAFKLYYEMYIINSNVYPKRKHDFDNLCFYSSIHCINTSIHWIKRVNIRRHLVHFHRSMASDWHQCLNCRAWYKLMGRLCSIHWCPMKSHPSVQVRFRVRIPGDHRCHPIKAGAGQNEKKTTVFILKKYMHQYIWVYFFNSQPVRLRHWIYIMRNPYKWSD